MLTRLIILNSNIYSKADIELEGCDSLQIVGPNNVGKSTLIYALNFLFIIDGREMTFSGNRKGDKNTFDHYFPSINSSFIVFEIFKNRFYSILVKKNAEGGLDYYKIDSEYKEEFYFLETTNGQKMRKFNSLLSEFVENGIDYRKFSNRRDVFNFVYQKEKGNNGVVWLNRSVNQDERKTSNNFSKIYKYLLNSKLIDNESLKEALIIADNRENEKVSFSKKNQKDIKKLLEKNQEVETIKRIQPRFAEFEKLVKEYAGRSAVLSELIFAFNEQYLSLHSELEISVSEMKRERSKNENHLNKILSVEKDALNRSLGKIETQIEQKQRAISEMEDLIAEIKSYDPFLEQSLQTLENRRKTTESRITQIEDQDLSSKDIKNSIQKDKLEILRKNNQVENYSRQLIHQISDNQEQKELLNRILSEEMTSLPAEHILIEIKETETSMKLFDGVIKLPDDLKGKSIESIEGLKQQIEQLTKEKKSKEDLLPIAQNLEKHRRDLEDLKGKIEVVTDKIKKLKKLPDFEEKLKDLKGKLKSLSKQKETTEKTIKRTEEEIEKLRKTIKQEDKEIFAKQKRIEEIRNWKAEIEKHEIEPSKGQSTDSLDNIYKKLKENLEKSRETKYKKDRLFEKLKDQTKTSFASETDFITDIKSEIAALEDKQTSIDGLLQSISTQFLNPCHRILSKFNEFKAFIANEFNSKIRKIKISDIDSLKIEIIENEKRITDLNKIIQIRDLKSALISEDRSENLNTLNKYLNDETTILFKDLFDIKLHLRKKDDHKVVDLKNQIESDGTDKMLRLVLIMSIINQMVIKDSENKIVLFIDEVLTIDPENRAELVNFCKDNFFIPIFASVSPTGGFDKYYYLLRGNKSKIIVSAKNGNVVLRKPKLK